MAVNHTRLSEGYESSSVYGWTGSEDDDPTGRKDAFHQLGSILDDEYQLGSTTPDTWVSRWENEREFALNLSDENVETARRAIAFDDTEIHRYLKQVIDSKPYIIVYHRAGESKLKHCSDVDHFHMVTASNI